MCVPNQMLTRDDVCVVRAASCNASQTIHLLLLINGVSYVGKAEKCLRLHDFIFRIIKTYLAPFLLRWIGGLATSVDNATMGMPPQQNRPSQCCSKQGHIAVFRGCRLRAFCRSSALMWCVSMLSLLEG